jgi:hypothetical protein
MCAGAGSEESDCAGAEAELPKSPCEMPAWMAAEAIAAAAFAAS